MNKCEKCTDGFITITLESGKVITVLCDQCKGYGDYEEHAK